MHFKHKKPENSYVLIAACKDFSFWSWFSFAVIVVDSGGLLLRCSLCCLLFSVKKVIVPLKLRAQISICINQIQSPANVLHVCLWQMLQKHRFHGETRFFLRLHTKNWTNPMTSPIGLWRGLSKRISGSGWAILDHGERKQAWQINILGGNRLAWKTSTVKFKACYLIWFGP